MSTELKTINGHTEEYWQGLEEGMKHVEPSPETMRRLLNLEEVCRPLPVFMQKVEDMLDLIDKKTTLTNGKVAEVSAWRERMIGAGMAVKTAWGVVGVVLITMTYALFSMWVQFQSIDSRIQKVVQNELEKSENNYEFDLTEE